MADSDDEVQGDSQYALQTVMAEDPELFVDVCDRPMIALPWQSPVNVLPLNSRRVRSEVSAFIYEKSKTMISDSDLRRVILVLEGIAWKDRRATNEQCSPIDDHPLIEALFLLLKQEEGFLEVSASKLLDKIEQIARSNRLDLRSPLWPKSAPALSRQLMEVQSSLTALCITLKRGRRSGGARFLKLSLSCDDTSVTPSQEPSAATS